MAAALGARIDPVIPTAITYIDNLVPSRGRFPFYIVAPRWTRTSAGIRSLHILCHWLNMTGQSAFMLIYPDWQGLQVNPDLQTPVLTEAIARHHFELGLPPVVVYPEVIAGNPFDAPVRVRWIGNYPGLLGGTATFDADELCFAHSEHLAKTVGTSHILNIPVLDTSVYRPTPVTRRAGSCFYAAKFQRVHNQEVFGLPEGCIEITRDGPGTLSPPEIADLFRRSELFYCFEDSALMNEAALCGCPVVMMKNALFSSPVAIDEAGWDGYAWGDDPDEVARARRTAHRAYDNYVRNVPKFFTQLYLFVLLAQKKASATPYVKPMRLLSSSGGGPAETGALRRTLLQALLDVEALRSGGTRADVLWTPEVTAAGAGGAVTLISGWSRALPEAVSSTGAVSCLAIVPPSAAKIVEIDLAGVAPEGAHVSVSVLDEQDLLESLDLGSGETRTVRLAVLEPGKPLILVLAQGRPITPALADAGASSFEAIRLLQVRARSHEERQASERSSDVSTADLAATTRIVLSDPSPTISLDAVNCVTRFDEGGLTIDASDSDPHVVFTLQKRLIATGRHAYLWGIAEASVGDEMQVFVPLAGTGHFSESSSPRVLLKAGTNAFTLTLPTLDDVQVLRLDPAHGLGITRFGRLELVLAPAAANAGPIVDAAGDPGPWPVPNLTRFSERSLLSGLDLAMTRGCTVATDQGLLRITTQTADCDLVFAFDPVVVTEGAAIYLVGDYDVALDDRLTVSLPSPESGAFDPALAVGCALQRGRGRFSLALPALNVLHLLRLQPLQRAAAIAFSRLSVVMQSR